MKWSVKSPNQCLYCGKQLSVFYRFRDLLYCNSSHRSAHVREIGKLGLSRLLAPRKSASEIRWERCERLMKQ